MRACPACQAENGEGAKFCSECGAALIRRCPACGAAANGRFCSECGAAIEAAGPTTAAAPEPPTAGDRLAERRITSVLFADLVGFTALSETRDPDDVRELLSRYFAAARTVIERYGGIVEKFIGDAVMAVWGVPVAHEDDAERAVRAGLDLVDTIAALGEEVGAAGLAMRVGVVTGDVAVNVGATGEGMVAGDSVNTASRVQTVARPGSVWVDEQTRALTAAAVDYDDEGEHELRGKQEPLRLFSVRRVIAAVGGARRVDGLEAPFCGRDRELRLVKELFHATIEEGRPRLVAVFGAAGIGKSRLGWEFEKYYDGINDSVMGHRGRCLSYGDGVAYWALAEIVQGRLGVLEGDGLDVVVERLHEGLEHYVPDPADRAWLLPRLAALLGVADTVAPGASFARDDLFAAWRTFLEQVARAEDAVGAVLRIDDLQWADPGLLEFIDHVIDTARAPIFILTLSRSELIEHAPGFGSGRRATALHLEPLPPAAMSNLVDGLVDGLPAQLRDALVARAEGVPLFAVETVRALIDRDAVIPHGGRYVLSPGAETTIDVADESLPTSLHTLIASRLDGLPVEERRIVQDAAVLGQAFSRDELAAVTSGVGDLVDVNRALDALVRKEIFAIESDPRSPERGQYRFVQAMVRTVSYETLSRRDRKLRHLRAAEHLANTADADTIPAVIASHFVDAHAAAGSDPDAEALASRAVELLERAAARANGLAAPAEARRHLENALRLVTAPERVGHLREAAARAALAAGAFKDAAELAERARTTYDAAGLPVDADRSLAVWGDAQLANGLGRSVIEPLAAAYQKLEAVAGTEDVRAALALGVARGYYLSVGDSASALPWFDRAVTLGEALEDLPLLTQTLASYAGALVLVGRSRMGLGLLRVSLDLARELDDPRMQLRPLNNMTSFLATRNLAGAKESINEAMAIVRRLKDREWGPNVVGSAMHVYWNAGQWDDAESIAAEVQNYINDVSPIAAIITCYRAAIQEARGLPVQVPDIAESPTGQRTDVVLEGVRDLVASIRLKSQGDIDAAAAASLAAVDKCVQASGIDDDFPIFWITAMTGQLATHNGAEAERLLTLVADAPTGYVPPLLRALLPWMRARVTWLTGEGPDPEKDFLRAESALRAFGTPPYLARTLVDHAEWLDAVHRPAEALPLLEEARELFAGLGVSVSAERAGTPVDAALAD